VNKLGFIIVVAKSDNGGNGRIFFVIMGCYSEVENIGRISIRNRKPRQY
jgi:hypothetical protein